MINSIIILLAVVIIIGVFYVLTQLYRTYESNTMKIIIGFMALFYTTTLLIFFRKYGAQLFAIIRGG